MQIRKKIKTFWRCRGSNPGPHTCKACALPLSYTPPGIVYCNTTLNVKAVQVWKIILEVPGIEPGASRMLSARSTTELHPLACTLMVKVLCLVSAILFKKKKTL